MKNVIIALEKRGYPELAAELKSLITARNIANQSDIKTFIKNIMLNSDSPLIDKWLKSNLRNYLLNKYGEVTPIIKYKSSDPDWLKKSIDKGDEVFEINITDDLREQIAHVIDFFNSMANNPKELKKLSKIAVPDAIKKSKEWTRQLTKPASSKEDWDGIKVVREYPDKFNWKQLLSKQALNREGKLMKHCVGDYCVRVKEGKTRIFSLRDPKNIPHVTMEVDRTGKVVKQIKGFANKGIKSKYTKYVKDFLKKPIKGLKFETISDLQNVGIIVKDGEWYNIYNLPENFMIDTLDVSDKPVEKLPDGLTVTNILRISKTKIKKLPKSLDVNILIMNNTKIEELPDDIKIKGLQAKNSLLKKLPDSIKGFSRIFDMAGTDIEELPDGFITHGSLHASDSKLKNLPKNLTIGANLVIENTDIDEVPEGLNVGKNFYAEGTNINKWAKNANVNGIVDLSGTPIKELPDNFSCGEDLILNGSDMQFLGKNLNIGGDLYIKYTDIKELPTGIKIGGDIYVSKDSEIAKNKYDQPEYLIDKIKIQEG